MKHTIFLLFFLLPSIVNATIIVVPNHTELINKSTNILFGSVVNKHTYRNKTGHIVTKVDVQIVTNVKGRAETGSIVSFEIPGGVLNEHITSYVSGSPSLKSGEMIFCYLINRGGILIPWGFSYGILKAYKNNAKQWILNRDFTGLQLMSNEGKEIAKNSIKMTNIALLDLIDEIKIHLTKQ